MRVSRYATTLLIAVLVSVLGIATSASANDSSSDNRDLLNVLGIEQPKKRIAAPAFSLELLSDASQKSLSDYRGKVVVINFWATWCAPCREEMPAMQALWHHYHAEGFEILAVAADRRGRKNVAPFIEQHGFEFPVLLDPDGEVRNRYEVVGLPMSYLIGRDGKISGRVVGVIDWQSPEAFQLIGELLQRPAI